MKKVTWQECDNEAERMAEEIKHFSHEIDSVYGVPRGGLFLAVLLAYKLDLPIITNERDITPKTLVCDDISDSGQTLIDLLTPMGPNGEFPKVATLVYNQRSMFRPDFYGIMNKDNEWIEFPYDTEQDTVSTVKKRE